MSIPKWRKDQIRELKAQGFSQREIARVTGTARDTVARVLSGPADADDARQREREARHELAEAPPERCPGCGRLVTMPCPGCLARNYLELKKHRGESRPRGEPIDRRPPPGLELREPHRARYEEIHDWKVQRRRIPWER